MRDVVVILLVAALTPTLVRHKAPLWPPYPRQAYTEGAAAAARDLKRGLPTLYILGFPLHEFHVDEPSGVPMAGVAGCLDSEKYWVDGNNDVIRSEMVRSGPPLQNNVLPWMSLIRNPTRYFKAMRTQSHPLSKTGRVISPDAQFAVEIENSGGTGSVLYPHATGQVRGAHVFGPVGGVIVWGSPRSGLALVVGPYCKESVVIVVDLRRGLSLNAEYGTLTPAEWNAR